MLRSKPRHGTRALPGVRRGCSACAEHVDGNPHGRRFVLCRMGLRSPVQCSPADAATQSFLRSAGQFRDAPGKARRRACGVEVTWRLHRLGGNLVSPACELRSSLVSRASRDAGVLFGSDNAAVSPPIPPLITAIEISRCVTVLPSLKL
jgi:hypothetical protein